MPPPRSLQRFRCRFCGVTFSAWLAVPGEPAGALLLHHIRQSHPAELKPFLDPMHTDEALPEFPWLTTGCREVRYDRRVGRHAGQA